MTGRTLYPCCQCCRPGDYQDSTITYASTCPGEDRHTLPCLMCGQKPAQHPDEEFLAHHPVTKPYEASRDVIGFVKSFTSRSRVVASRASAESSERRQGSLLPARFSSTSAPRRGSSAPAGFTSTSYSQPT